MKEITFYLNGENSHIKRNKNTYILPYPCDSQTNCYPYTALLPPGYYKFEVWGAQGGHCDSREGGKGGYARGVLNNKKKLNAFFYVGAEGFCKDIKLSTSTSFNGGGSGKSSFEHKASSGGGASDIRLVEDSIYHRVIVAGGGGGSGQYGSNCTGGAGGGTTGIDGMNCYSELSYGGPKGTQTSGGISEVSRNNGIFGYGGNTTHDGCGGGGGWFGGAAGYGYVAAGGGGSGFVFNFPNLENAKERNLKLNKTLLLYKAETFSGNTNFPSPRGQGYEHGHESNGVISITILDYSNKQKILCSIKVFIFKLFEKE